MQGKSSLLPAEPAATITVATNDDCLTYTVAQAARLAGVSVSYYYRAAHQGLVPASSSADESSCPRRHSAGSSVTPRPQAEMKPRERGSGQTLPPLWPAPSGR